jgi:hypothetical protein
VDPAGGAPVQASAVSISPSLIRPSGTPAASRLEVFARARSGISGNPAPVMILKSE